MRICQARFSVAGTIVAAAVSLLLVPGLVSPGFGQQKGASGATSAPATGRGGSTTPSNPTTTPTQPQTTTESQQPPRTIWVAGKVMMYDGTPPPAAVTIERVCAANSVRAEGYSDSTGHFSFNLGQNNGVFADASESIFPDFGQPGGMSSSSGNSGNSSRAMSNSQDMAFTDCEIRARLAGYRSDTVSLAGRRSLDNPDIGVIILYPLAGIQGLMSSATSSLAPKDACKAYEKGLDNLKKAKLEQAEAEFRKAVQLYPRYAAAWMDLGKMLEKKEFYAEAREAYKQPIFNGGS